MYKIEIPSVNLLVILILYYNNNNTRSPSLSPIRRDAM